MAEQIQKPVVIRFGKFKWVAAAFLLGIIAGMCLLSPMMGSKGLFDSNFLAHEDDVSQTIDMGLSTRGAGASPESIKALKRLREGMDYYNAKNYPEAIKIFEDHVRLNGQAYDVNGIKFYLGVSYLALKEDEATHKARLIFQELLQNEKFSRREDTQWYLALAYIQTKNADAAKPILTELKNSKTYKTKAEDLLVKADNPEGPKKERPVYFR